MSKRLPDLRRRQNALQKTMDRFGAKPFTLGIFDCVQMTRFHLKAMGVKNLPLPQKYENVFGAKTALKALGHATLEQLFDGLLERIPPAAMLPGDIALLPSEPGEEAADIGTVAICLGRKLMGWHPDHETIVVMEVSVVTSARRA